MWHRHTRGKSETSSTHVPHHDDRDGETCGRYVSHIMTFGWLPGGPSWHRGPLSCPGIIEASHHTPATLTGPGLFVFIHSLEDYRDRQSRAVKATSYRAAAFFSCRTWLARTAVAYLWVPRHSPVWARIFHSVCDPEQATTSTPMSHT